MSLREILLGRPLADTEAESEKIGPLKGLPLLGLDALASAAYGPEALLTVLLVLGAQGLRWLTPLMMGLIVLLALVGMSYRQTISAYPQGGGSYTVARENLGTKAALLAAASLALDYLLNVSVAISAGVGALVSAEPKLLPYTLPLCLVLLVLITLVNLRGVRAAGAAFMVPAYAFIACLGGALLWGAAKVLLHSGPPQPVVAPPPVPAASGAFGVWLLLRAFANGCTAMTGIEAVSNAVPIFREPRTREAQRTLTVILALLILLLAGIAFLCRAYGIGATHPGAHGYQSVLSQLVAAVSGRGIFYHLTLFAIVAVLCLSANTSFADFPRVCRMVALDGYLPAVFAHAGGRLVYNTGILTLAFLSALLLIAFRGITDRLIPLFAVGALGAFTLSQTGMVAHWRRTGGPHARHSMIFNAAGAVATATTLVIVIISKFTEGAWLTVLFIPLVVGVFWGVHVHHERIQRETASDGPLELEDLKPPRVVVPLRALDAVTRKALRFALSLSPDVQAVQVRLTDLPTPRLARTWREQVELPAREQGRRPPRLVILRSSYRQLVDPILSYVRKLASEEPDRFIAVLIPELVERRWYHSLLHSHRATLLKLMLLRHGGPRVVLINTPWHESEAFSREARPPAQPRGRQRRR